MGGRGASSGISGKSNKGGGGKKYGTQFKTILTDGNIKFVAKTEGSTETLFETMTPGRVYVRTGGNDLLQIIYFDRNNKRTKTIDLSHKHDGVSPHTHHGYEHSENDSTKGYANLTGKERKMVDRVRRRWQDYLNNGK